MKLIVGLGNPGKKYERTRHNVGFLVLDELAKQYGTEFYHMAKFRSEVAEIIEGKTKSILLKPQTFMNLSGEAVAAAMAFWKISPEDIVVVYDDADLPFGETRLRREGSSGGHKGMHSVIESLGREDISRVRIGIGRPDNPNILLEDWVLNTWTAAEEKNLQKIIERAVSQLYEYGRNDYA